MIKIDNSTYLQETINRYADTQKSLETQLKAADNLAKQLIQEVEFLLPYATKAILERQLCIENKHLQDTQDELTAMFKLIRSDYQSIIDLVVQERRIDLLQKLIGQNSDT